jgi:diketogulonate reductase-like aldo/keto reductase
VAWVLSRGPDIVPISGTKRRRWLEENAQAIDITLSSDDLERLDQAASPEAVHGDRYHDAEMALLNRSERFATTSRDVLRKETRNAA